MDWENAPPFGIGNEEKLYDEFLAHCNTHLSEIKLKPVISKQRNLEAFSAWKEDLYRSCGGTSLGKGSFRNKSVVPDHIKSSAHLTYWIRRSAPIVSMESISEGMYSESETIAIELNIENLDGYTEVEGGDSISLNNGMSLNEFQANRERVFAYANELFAFTFGFKLAKAYQEQKLIEGGGSPRSIAYPDGKYIEDFCYFLKFKSVSPHSIDLIYRALLKNFV